MSASAVENRTGGAFLGDVGRPMWMLSFAEHARLPCHLADTSVSPLVLEFSQTDMRTVLDEAKGENCSRFLAAVWDALQRSFVYDENGCAPVMSAMGSRVICLRSLLGCAGQEMPVRDARSCGC